mgnify:CR=1 FL=1
MHTTIIVTRHAALVEFLFREGIAERGTSVITHVTDDDVRDKHVIGVLPMHLAALAASVTEIPLTLTPEMRGKELSLEEVCNVAGDPVTYVINTLSDFQRELESSFMQGLDN